MEFEYDASLDRIDVAVRSVWHDAKKGGKLAREAGVSAEVIAQVQALERLKPTSERQVFAVLRLCPGLLPAALLMLHSYYLSCGDGRTAFYERLEAL